MDALGGAIAVAVVAGVGLYFYERKRRQKAEVENKHLTNKVESAKLEERDRLARE